MDKRVDVEIYGTSRVDMNGKRGVATDFHYYEDEGKRRYTVKLDGGEAFKVKPANLRAEGSGGGDGGEAGRARVRAWRSAEGEGGWQEGAGRTQVRQARAGNPSAKAERVCMHFKQ